jgi:hypothetical protein
MTVTLEPGAVEASSRCSWTVLKTESAGQSGVVLTGQYLDRFVKVDGAWRFADRYIETDPVA